MGAIVVQPGFSEQNPVQAGHMGQHYLKNPNFTNSTCVLDGKATNLSINQFPIDNLLKRFIVW